MESTNSASCEPKNVVEAAPGSQQDHSDQWFSERFESLLPKIQDQWPDMAKQTLEATRGSLDEVVRVISEHSGKTSQGVQEQLEDLFHSATDTTKDIADSLEPLEKQLVMLTLDKSNPGKPLLLHDEPIYFENKIVGETTSGNYSFNYNKNLRFGYISSDLKVEDIAKKKIEVEIEKIKYAASLLLKHLKNPKIKLN